MWDLFKAELLRFRPWALGYAAVHVVWLGFLTRVVDLAQQPLTVYQAVGTVYGATGLLLGLYQMGGYGARTRGSTCCIARCRRGRSPRRCARRAR